MEWDKKPPFEIRDPSALRGLFGKHCEQQLALIHLQPVFSEQRLLDVFCAWKEDLNRSRERNFRNDKILPDHIKAAAHLTYWIRREAPIIDLITAPGALVEKRQAGSGKGTMYDEEETIQIERDSEEIPNTTVLDEKEMESLTLPNGMSFAELLANRSRAFAYGNELFAFTFGLSLAKAYEEQKQKEQGHLCEIPWPSGAYIDDLCYFLKFKSVSPHSLDLIYRALLREPR
jgi:hypothetical protein